MLLDLRRQQVELGGAIRDDYERLHPMTQAGMRGGYVFSFQSKTTVWRYWKEAARRAGIELITPHQAMRHTFASNLHNKQAGTWTSDGQDGSDSGIYGQRYDAAGSSVGAEFRISTYTTSDQNSSTVTSLEDGGTLSPSGQDGADGLQDQSPKPKHAWNRIPYEVRRKVV